MIGHPFGDTYEYTHHIWWINHALRRAVALFQPVLLYPMGWKPHICGAPRCNPSWLLMFIMPLPVAFNLSALLTLALNGWAMWVLSRQLLADSRQPSTIKQDQSNHMKDTMQGHALSLQKLRPRPPRWSGIYALSHSKGNLPPDTPDCWCCGPCPCPASVLQLRDEASRRQHYYIIFLAILASWRFKSLFSFHSCHILHHEFVG
jgi:hypothetical protein